MCTSGGAGCGALSYPAALWEFVDSTSGSALVNPVLAPPFPVFFDEDDVDGDGLAYGNGFPDLGATWSVPQYGRVVVCQVSGADCKDPDDLETRHVVVFGGGLDVLNKTAVAPDSGNWIYMLDVETGLVLYKRQVMGGVPSTVGLVDLDQDTLSDRIYFGTTAGFLYRIDLGPKADGNYL